MAALTELDKFFGPSGLIDFNVMRASMGGDVTNVSLIELADSLGSLTPGDTPVDMTVYADQLREAYTSMVQPIEAGRERLLVEMYYEEMALNSMSFSAAANNLVFSEAMINANGSLIISAYINTTADTVYFLVVGFADETAYSVENDIARCGTLYASATLVLDSGCVRTLYPVNGLWYSLGWCLAFFIPHLFLAVQLAAAFSFHHGGGPGSGSTNSVAHMDDVTSTYSTSMNGGMTSSELEMKALFYK